MLAPLRSVVGFFSLCAQDYLSAVLIGVVCVSTVAISSPDRAQALDLSSPPLTAIPTAGDSAPPEKPGPPNVDIPRLVQPVDLNGDGREDVIAIASKKKIVWYQNQTAEEGNRKDGFGPPKTIVKNLETAQSLATTDVDGDGDQDILFVAYFESTRRRAFWIENQIGESNASSDRFGAPQAVSSDTVDVMSVEATDIDGDGDQDIVSVYDRGETGKLNISVTAIVWKENRIGENPMDNADFGEPNEIVSQRRGKKSIHLVDLDGDADPDVVYGTSISGRGSLDWFENQIGEEEADDDGFGPRKTIAEDYPAFYSSADVDGDGDQDILTDAGSDSHLVWYENQIGQGGVDSDGFGPARKIDTQGLDVQSVEGSDLDGDGDEDLILSGVTRTSSEEVVWMENEVGSSGDASRGFSERKTISSGGRGVDYPISAVDLNGDEDEDILAAFAFSDQIFWHENRIGDTGAESSGFSDRKLINDNEHSVIATSMGSITSARTADVDGDGDQDVLAALWEGDGRIVWFENRTEEEQGDRNRFADPQTVTTAVEGPESLYFADLDGDQDKDLLSASRDGKLAWYENRGGEGGANGDAFGPQQVIASVDEEVRSVHAADLDGDGDPDVLSASRDYDKIAWHENKVSEEGGGSDGFGDQQVITIVRKASTVHAADFDGDGDQDVLAAGFSSAAGVTWYENRVEEGDGFGSKRIIRSPSHNANNERYTSVQASDLDGDGDQDVVFAFQMATPGDILWSENRIAEDGKQDAFNEAQGINSGGLDRLHSVYTTDLDGTGNPEVISASDCCPAVRWYRNDAENEREKNGEFASWRQHDVSTGAITGALHVHTADLDGDGDQDILYTSRADKGDSIEAKLGWYENTPERIPPPE